MLRSRLQRLRWKTISACPEGLPGCREEGDVELGQIIGDKFDIARGKVLLDASRAHRFGYHHGIGLMQ